MPSEKTKQVMDSINERAKVGIMKVANSTPGKWARALWNRKKDKKGPLMVKGQGYYNSNYTNKSSDDGKPMKANLTGYKKQ